MDARHLKTAYSIEPGDLPNQQGTVVQIVGVDTEYSQFIENGISKDKATHVLKLYGWRLPLRLNNIKVDTLIAIFGPETDHWIGKKVVLAAVPVTAFGQTKLGVTIMPLLADAPVSAAPQHMLPRPGVMAGQGFRLPQQGAGGNGWAQQAASNQYAAQSIAAGVTAAFALPQTPTAPAAPSAPSGPPLEQLAPLGVPRAAKLLTELYRRAQDWTAFLNWLKTNHTAAFEACSGKSPDAVPVWAAIMAKQFMMPLQVANTGEGAEAKFLAMLAPPPPPAPAPEPNAAAVLAPTEIIDKTTGEVLGVNVNSLPNDDIPF
jgi:hypothetical protein